MKYDYILSQVFYAYEDIIGLNILQNFEGKLKFLGVKSVSSISKTKFDWFGILFYIKLFKNIRSSTSGLNSNDSFL